MHVALCSRAILFVDFVSVLCESDYCSSIVGSVVYPVGSLRNRDFDPFGRPVWDETILFVGCTGLLELILELVEWSSE